MSNYDEIDEVTAREIAGYWHSGQWSPLYMFASSGATHDSRYDLSDILHEARQSYHADLLHMTQDDARQLRSLITYLENLEADDN